MTEKIKPEVRLIEHRKKDYPERMYRQPLERFFHVEAFSEQCHLCTYDLAREVVEGASR